MHSNHDLQRNPGPLGSLLDISSDRLEGGGEKVDTILPAVHTYSRMSYRFLLVIGQMKRVQKKTYKKYIWARTTVKVNVIMGASLLKFCNTVQWHIFFIR